VTGSNEILGGYLSRMDFGRVRKWDWLTGLAGLVLFVDLFMPWYRSGGVTATAWQSFAFIDLILALAALLAMDVVLVSAFSRAEAPAKLVAACAFWVGLVGAILAVFRVIKRPAVDIVVNGGAEHVVRDWGLFVGVLAAIALVWFAWRARQEMVSTRPLRSYAASGQARES
jgi:hypothetical protein